jgi:hypothetical protein
MDVTFADHQEPSDFADGVVETAPAETSAPDAS